MIKILVCIKQAYVTSANIELNNDKSWIRYNPLGFKMNSYDEYAVEEALRIKEYLNKYNKQAIVHVVSVGPDRVQAIIRRAMEMGADEGVHIHYENVEFLSAYQIAHLLATYARDNHYNIILTGVMAEDNMSMQTGQMIGSLLGYPYISSVIYQEVRFDNLEHEADNQNGLHKQADIFNNCCHLYVERECEAKQRQVFEINMPCVLTIQSGINKPRYPSLSNVLRARKQKITKLNAMDMQIPKAKELIVKIFQPEVKPKGIFLDKTAQQKAIKLLEILHEKSFI